MLPAEILAQVRRIEIRTGRLVTETFAGEYLSVFKGRGMEFAEARDYVPGDDVRTIDWNLTARFGKPYVKLYMEERELTVILACDVSGSQYFGTQNQLKKEIAAEIAALLAFSAIRNNDKVGLALFTKEIEVFIPPKKGRQHILRLIRELLTFEPKSKGTDIGASLDTLNHMLKRRGVIFLISDFLGEGFGKPLRQTNIKHDVVPIWVEDPSETGIPRVRALLELEDPETGRRICINAGSPGMRSRFEEVAGLRHKALERFFKVSGMDFIYIRTDRPYIDSIVNFFKARARRFRW